MNEETPNSKLATSEDAAAVLTTVPLQLAAVLVVDDSETSRQILAESLRSMTFDVGLATTGEGALVELDRAADAGRPVQDGPTLADKGDEGDAGQDRR